MNFKKIITVFALLVLTLALAVSCGGACEHDDADNDGVCDKCSETIGEPDSGSTTYTVTVKDQYGQPAVGLSVTLQVNMTKLSALTDSNGVAAFDVDVKNIVRLEAEVNTLLMPEAGISEFNRELDYFAEFAEGATNVNVQVTRLEAQYVYVKDSEGNGVAGVGLQICHLMCPATLFVTDGEGRATVYFENPITYAIVKSAPAGYEFDVNEHFNAPASGDLVIVIDAAE